MNQITHSKNNDGFCYLYQRYKGKFKVRGRYSKSKNLGKCKIHNNIPLWHKGRNSNKNVIELFRKITDDIKVQNQFKIWLK